MRKQYDWQIPPEIEARLAEDSYGPQRAIFEAGHLFLVLHAPPGPEDVGRTQVLFLRTPEGALLCNGKPDGKEQFNRLISEYRKHYETCNRLYDEAESAEDLLKLMERLAPINRASTNLADTLQEAREHAKRDRFFIGVRDEAHEISRSFELLFTDTKHALDYRIAKHAEDQAERVAEMTVAQHKLNILAAFTFPVMAIATLFGMNLTSGLENLRPIFFWLGLGIGVAIGFVVKSWVLSTKK